jgi:FlaA1/EpsC-like NDP-sugar epimerase
LLLNRRIAAVALHDIFMAALSFEISVLVRYYTYGAPQSPGYIWPATVVFTVVCFIAFWRTGLYRGIWYYASFNDLVAIVKAVTLSILVFLAIMFVATRLQDFPRTALLINWPLLIFLLAGPRFLYRALKDGNWRAAFERNAETRIPVLLVGAGDAAEMFIRDQSRGRNANYRVVGIVDDKPNRIGRDIRGVRVMAAIADLDQVIATLDNKGQRPQRLIIASDRIDGAVVRDLLDKAESLGMALARVPRLTDFSDSDSDTQSPRMIDTDGQLQAIDIADLLGRPRKVLDRDAMARLIAGKRVLVTGAGGTIGSELVRQTASFGPAHMTLLDNGEYNLYRIDMEMSEKYADLSREAVLGDVRDTARLAQVFATETPDIVFHAAAFKHVPLNERNPNEAALTNCIGTWNVAEACRAQGIGTMVQISTDKAVNPTNVMGATKRIAEMVCQSLNLARTSETDTRFVTVRFGNVLGSTGSVVPLFQRQLAAGGPLTVTHPDITRYFMTTGEAVELVLQASAFPETETTSQGNQGEVFVLDMGEPVRIQDMARQMIRLSGLQPDKDIAVEFTGLRPGEKLYEELFHDTEQLVQTAHEGIMLAAPRTIDHAELKNLLEQLTVSATARQTKQSLDLIKVLVPEFESDLITPSLTAASE